MVGGHTSGATRAVALGLTIAVASLGCTTMPVPTRSEPSSSAECMAACQAEQDECEAAATAGHCLMAPVYIIGAALVLVLAVALVGGGGSCGGGDCGNGPVGHDTACRDVDELCQQACMGYGPGENL